MWKARAGTSGCGGQSCHGLAMARARDARAGDAPTARNSCIHAHTCAASLGFYDLRRDDAPEFLHSVTDAALPPQFVEAYHQIRLDLAAGGHGMRSWAEHADAAFVTCTTGLARNSPLRGMILCRFW